MVDPDLITPPTLEEALSVCPRKYYPLRAVGHWAPGIGGHPASRMTLLRRAKHGVGESGSRRK